MDTILETNAGTLRGSLTDGVRTFLGVPYGGPLSGTRRFTAPTRVEPWVGVRDALRFGPSAWQLAIPNADEMLDMWGGRAEPALSEDCLVLNVWAPEAPEEPLPVLVYLHGGGHAVGSGSWPAYHGDRLARHGRAVVVTVNHRLNVFGYLYLAELAGDRFATSGINGILDIVEALRWVQANIARIGGDPDRVLVYGQSGGAGKTAALMTMPAADGLFQSAAMMSGGSGALLDADAATTVAEQLLEHLGLTPANVDALFELPAQQLYEASLQVAPMFGFAPVLDGTVAVGQLADLLAQGRAPAVPLLIGTTRDEAANLQASAMPADGDDAWLVEQARAMSDRPEEVIAVLQRARPSASTRELYVALATFSMMRAGAISLADARASAGGAPVWMYRFDWETPVAPHTGLAPHGVDTTFFFDQVDAAAVTRVGPQRAELGAAASECLVALAGNGSPQHPGLPTWDRYDVIRRATMIFDSECHMVDDPDASLRSAWSTPSTEPSAAPGP